MPYLNLSEKKTFQKEKKSARTHFVINRKQKIRGRSYICASLVYKTFRYCLQFERHSKMTEIFTSHYKYSTVYGIEET